LWLGKVIVKKEADLSGVTNVHQFHREVEKVKHQYETKPKNKHVDELVDSNVGHHCLKLFAIFLKIFANNKMAKSERFSLLSEIQKDNHALICNLLWLKSNPEANSSETEDKMNEMLGYLLELIYKIFPNEFSFLAEKLGIDHQQKQEPEQQDKKKSDLKSKQSKLLAKMRNKG
jgi:hypothetical protein